MFIPSEKLYNNLVSNGYKFEYLNETTVLVRLTHNYYTIDLQLDAKAISLCVLATAPDEYVVPLSDIYANSASVFEEYDNGKASVDQNVSN